MGQIDAVHVLASDTATSRRVSGVRVRTSAHSDRVVEDRGGILLTSPADTCIDIARLRHPAAGLVTADAAIRRGSAAAAALGALNEDRASARGRRQARWALARADGAAESALESVSRAAAEHGSWADVAEPSGLRDILLSAGLTPNSAPDLHRLSGLGRLVRAER